MTYGQQPSFLNYLIIMTEFLICRCDIHTTDLPLFCHTPSNYLQKTSIDINWNHLNTTFATFELLLISLGVIPGSLYKPVVSISIP